MASAGLIDWFKINQYWRLGTHSIAEDDGRVHGGQDAEHDSTGDGLELGVVPRGDVTVYQLWESGITVTVN